MRQRTQVLLVTTLDGPFNDISELRRPSQALQNLHSPLESAKSAIIMEDYERGVMTAIDSFKPVNQH